MSETAVVQPSSVHPFHEPSRRRRLIKVAAWLVGIVLAIVVLIVVLVVFIAIFPRLFRGSFDVDPQRVADVMSLNER